MKQVNADDFDTKALDEKFEKMSRECAEKMDGTRQKPKLTPKDYDRWDGKIGLRLVNGPKNSEKKKNNK